jgi:SAM-dependent methyltransferase
VDGLVTCSACSRDYPIRDGILSLLDRHLHPESDNEMRARDARNDEIRARVRTEWRSDHADSVEVRPTLAALEVEPRMTVAELGCGTGRYTVDLTARSSTILALDLSRSGLLVLRQKLDICAPVVLVQADATKPFGAPGAFDRVLSTLHSNLPTGEHRARALRHSARALTDSGKAVISMHHRNFPDFIRGVASSGRYPDSGIYRYYMTKGEARREALRFFKDVRFVYLSAVLPRLPVATVSQVAARVPLVRGGLARLFLAVGELPRRTATDSSHSRPETVGRAMTSSERGDAACR